VKKKFFKTMSCVGIAAIMGLTAIGLSGCSNVIEQLGTLFGLLINSFRPVSEEERIAKRINNVKSSLRVEDGTWLCDALEETTINVSLEYYNSTMGGWSGDGESAAILDFSEPIAYLVQDSSYWLPLPLAKNVENFFEQYIEDFLTEGDFVMPQEVNGYWTYINSGYYLSSPWQEGDYLYEIDINNFNFASSQYVFAWYNTAINRIYFYELNL
jgi:hypothetical protein